MAEASCSKKLAEKSVNVEFSANVVRVKTILCRYQMYIVTLQLGTDIVMKVELCIFTSMVTVSQSSMFLYFRFLVTAEI